MIDVCSFVGVVMEDLQPDFEVAEGTGGGATWKQWNEWWEVGKGVDRGAEEKGRSQSGWHGQKLYGQQAGRSCLENRQVRSTHTNQDAARGSSHPSQWMAANPHSLSLPNTLALDLLQMAAPTWQAKKLLQEAHCGHVRARQLLAGGEPADTQTLNQRAGEAHQDI